MVLGYNAGLISIQCRGVAMSVAMMRMMRLCAMSRVMEKLVLKFVNYLETCNGCPNAEQAPSRC